jgi:uncharacterized membrane protein
VTSDLLQLHLVASVWMTAIIWYVQLVHYPSFTSIASETFCEFHTQHSRRTTFLVLVPMLVELASSAALVWESPEPFVFVLAGLTLLTWALTFLVSVPLHNCLARGKDHQAISKLKNSNWLRTLTWTLKLLLVLALQSGHGAFAT